MLKFTPEIELYMFTVNIYQKTPTLLKNNYAGFGVPK